MTHRWIAIGSLLLAGILAVVATAIGKLVPTEPTDDQVGASLLGGRSHAIEPRDGNARAGDDRSQQPRRVPHRAAAVGDLLQRQEADAELDLVAHQPRVAAAGLPLPPPGFLQPRSAVAEDLRQGRTLRLPPRQRLRPRPPLPRRRPLAHRRRQPRHVPDDEHRAAGAEQQSTGVGAVRTPLPRPREAKRSLHRRRPLRHAAAKE